MRMNKTIYNIVDLLFVSEQTTRDENRKIFYISVSWHYDVIFDFLTIRVDFKL